MRAILCLMVASLLCGRALGDDQALVQRLIRQLRSAEFPGDRINAAYDLGKLGPRAKEAVPALLEVLKLKNEEDVTNETIRIGAVRALGAIVPDGKGVIPHIAPLLGERSEIRLVATETLATIGPPAIPALVEKLATKYDKDGEEVGGTFQFAAKALGMIGQPAVPAILDALKEPSKRKGAADALGHIGPRAAGESVPVLLRYIEDPDYYVRFSVYAALGDIGPAAAAAVPALLAALDRAGDEPVDAATALGKIGPAAKAALPRLERLWEEGGRHNPTVKLAIDRIRGQRR